MIYRDVYGSICEIKKIDFPNDKLYYTRLYENMLNIAKGKNGLEKAFYNKNKKQSNKQNKNIAASNVDI